MKIDIDLQKCAGHAICTIIAPDVFDLNDEGKAILIPGWENASESDIMEAANACPALAIKVTKGSNVG